MSGLRKKPTAIPTANPVPPVTKAPTKQEDHGQGDDVVIPGPVVVSKPWYTKAREHLGKTEFDKGFTALLAPFWKKLYGLSFKDLIGSSHAWCGLFVGAMLTMAGAAYTDRGAAAIAWDNYGQKIEWRKDGIPQGAIVRINHNGSCSSSAGNHVTFADGDCTATDLLKEGATFNALGGNQGNQVKVSTYAVAEICTVSWPPKFTKPPKVTKSVNCSGKKTAESTR